MLTERGSIDMDDRKELCMRSLEGLSDNDLRIACSFSNDFERLAKIRDAINDELLRQVAKLRALTQGGPAT